MELLTEQGNNGQWRLGPTPTEEQADLIRKVVGLSKRRTVTPERKEALQSHAKAIREKTRGTLAQSALVSV
jgi:hypothetical protein